MTNILFSFLFLLAFTTSVEACSYAYQYSFFPLGTRGKNEWIMIHLEMERNVNTPDNVMGGAGGRIRPKYNDNFTPSADMVVRWRGTLRLVVLNTTTQEVSFLAEVANNIDIDDKTYHDELRPYFAQAAQLAREQPDFEPANIETVGYCRHDNDCPYLQKEIDTTAVQLNWIIENQQKYSHKAPAVFPNAVLQKFENMTHLDFTELEKVAASSRIEYFKAWKPYSVRIYKAGAQELILYSIGWGQKRFYTSTKAPTWEVPNIGGVEEYIEGNDILFHGQRFDFFYVVKPN
jgi:hypothetical protein